MPQHDLTDLLSKGFSLLLKQQSSSALECFLKVLELDPGNPDASDGSCCCLLDLNNYNKAFDMLLNCISLGKATDSNILNFITLLMRRPKRYAEVRDLIYEQMMSRTNNLEIPILLADLEEAVGNPDKALGLLLWVTKKQPDKFEVLAKIALLHISKGDAEAGMASLLQASILAPSDPKLRYYHGKATFFLNDHTQALESFLDYCRKTPNEERFADIDSLIGLCYLMNGDLDNSLVYLEKSLQNAPDNVNALINSYNAYRCAGEIEKSIDCCMRILSAEALPNDGARFKSFSNLMLLYSGMGVRGATHAAALASTYWNNQQLQSRHCYGQLQPKKSSSSRVKIGILSAEVGDHVVSFFLEPILRYYPRDLVELELILTVLRYENNTDRILSLPEKVVNLSGLSIESARQLLRDAHYDILIETTGYTSNSSLELLSERCAPIQCHYIGYHASTFMHNIDYFIADHELIPQSIESQFSEKILRVRGPWISRYVPSNLPIAQYKGDDERYVMGSTNQSAKLTKETLLYWIEALQRVDNSVLIVKDRFALSKRVQKRLLQILDDYRIARNRLSFVGGHSNWQEHMDFYNSLDVVLDATPWSASTTAFDAIMMGTPFIAIRGSVAAARMSASILSAANLDQYIADDVSGFGDIIDLHSSRKDMHRRNRNLYQVQNLSSPVFDVETVAASVFETLLGLA